MPIQTFQLIKRWHGDLEIIDQLLEAKAEVDSGQPYGNALQQAAVYGSFEVVTRLVEAGAAINAAAFEGI